MRNYSILEKLSGYKMALNESQVLCTGEEIYLNADHAHLKWMATAKDGNACVTRWFLELQAFSLYRGAQVWEIALECRCPVQEGLIMCPSPAHSGIVGRHDCSQPSLIPQPETS